MDIIRCLIEKKTLKILDLLIKNKQKYSHLSEISKQSRIPVASTFRIINRLASINLVEVTIIGKMKIYRISLNNKTKNLESIIKYEM